MKKINKIIIVLVIFFCNSTNIFAEIPYYIDFKYILNQSAAGKGAQDKLKNKLDKGINSLNQKEKSIQEEEKKLISQKKILKPEEYKNKVQQLRSKVIDLQKQRNKLLQGVADQRSKARSELLKNLNPIIKDYMKEKKIRMVIDKKSLLLADENLDLTKDIMDRLNKKLKSIKIN
jgi:Skp family chaperone for outer membrane proteins